MRSVLANHRYLTKQGFSLLELLLVIGIIAIVSTAITVAYNSRKIYSQSETTLAEADKMNLINAIDQYYFSHQIWPGGIDNQAKMIGTATSGCDVFCQIDGQSQKTAPVCLNLKNILDNDTLIMPLDKNFGSEEKSFYAVKVSGKSAKFYPCDNICRVNCNNKECGDDDCGGSCGSCTGYDHCSDNQQCVCTPNCTNKKCGTDGCGGVCGTCLADETCSSQFKCQQIPLAIGDSFQGGKVAYILQAGDPGYSTSTRHVIISAVSDQSQSVVWGCRKTLISGADGLALGTGKQNTVDIMAGCSTPGIAARLCGDLIINGYDDWYMPSRDELNKLYLSRNIIGGFNGPSTTRYLASSESSATDAWLHRFATNSQATNSKSTAYRVRCIRSF